jgi:hypothetical protein
MPAKNSKRKSNVGEGEDGLAAKKAKNLQIYEKMKLEAEANKKKAAEKKQQENKSNTKSRRTTIAATSSSRSQKVVEKPPRRSVGAAKIDKKPTPSRRASSRRIVPPSASVSSEDEEEEEGDDPFARLVQQSNSRPNSGNSASGRSEPPSENIYAQVYTQPSSRPPSKRQRDFLKRQKELFEKAQKGYHSSDDSESEEEEEEEDLEVEVEVEEAKAKAKKVARGARPEEPTAAAASACISAVAGAGGRKDEMMMQIDAILFSIVAFFLGFLLVIGVYLTLTSLDMNYLFTSLFGSTFTDLSGHIQGMAKRIGLLSIALVMTFGAIEIFLWFNRRANRKV